MKQKHSRQMPFRPRFQLPCFPLSGGHKRCYAVKLAAPDQAGSPDMRQNLGAQTIQRHRLIGTVADQLFLPKLPVKKIIGITESGNPRGRTGKMHDKRSSVRPLPAVKIEPFKPFSVFPDRVGRFAFSVLIRIAVPVIRSCTCRPEHEIEVKPVNAGMFFSAFVETPEIKVGIILRLAYLYHVHAVIIECIAVKFILRTCAPHLPVPDDFRGIAPNAGIRGIPAGTAPLLRECVVMIVIPCQIAEICPFPVHLGNLCPVSHPFRIPLKGEARHPP